MSWALEAKFLFACMLISSAVSYYIWSRARVVIFRQDLFEIRDELFDNAASVNGLEDSGYKNARRSLNALIRFAHLWSIPFFAAAIVRHPVGHAVIISDNPEINQFIRQARDKAGSRIARYLMYETMSGWILYVVVRICSVLMHPPSIFLRWLEKRISKFLETQPDISEACDDEAIFA